MARVVEAVVPRFLGAVKWEILFTKQLSGALRHAELSRTFGKPAPVPSIFIDGSLAFDTIPGTEELEKHIQEQIQKKRDSI